MGLAEKMFSRVEPERPVGENESMPLGPGTVESLFDGDWEVFVIRRNEKDEFDWFTLCCEAADANA